MRTITAPGVEIKEIDKSQYSPAMTGTACYVMGFANKGEPYKPMEITSRSAFQSYYGTPDNEAERYFYNAAVEVLNQNGRLYTARLPYDNEAFEKMAAVKYSVKSNQKLSSTDNYAEVKAADAEINDFAEISTTGIPTIYDLATIDEYRTDEKKVPAGTFLIVDTTGSTYGKVVEDSRKGQKREVIGIIPVVTTAANAMYAQSLINADMSTITQYEPLAGTNLQTLKLYDEDGNIVKIDNVEMQNAGLSAIDVVTPFNNDGRFTNITKLYKYQTNFYHPGDDNANVKYKDDVIEYLTSNDPDNTILKDSFVSCLASRNNETQIWEPIGDWDVVYDDDNWDTRIVWTYRQRVEISQAEIDANESLKSQLGWHGVNGDDTIADSLSLDAGKYFSTIHPAADGDGLDPEHLKDIGVCVYKAFLDPSEGNKVNYELVEAYCGSLCKDDKDPNTGATKFIDSIINSNSEYINFFSNCFASKADKKWYNDTCDILISKPSTGAVLGLYSAMTKEDISISKSIYDGMNKAFDKVSDINERDIDIVCDAGISNIASYLKAIFNNKGPYDMAITDDLGNSLLNAWKCVKSTDESIMTWKTVVQKFDNFCKNVRKDCMFITECPRPLVIQGQKKLVRDSKPSNTIDTCILPFVKVVSGINTNYGAGYMDWFQVADEATGDFFWLPPSIKAMGTYINTDVNFNYWDAPAGLNRGVIAATDVAFSPTAKQAGAIYEKNWNYAINYPNDGIVLEGQKTFQVKPSAFDRVNVRRLFLRLERAAYQVARYFVYEGNTAYTRQRLIDALDPYFKAAKIGRGIYDYMIVCDESINDAATIDRNELKVKIGIKPVKAAEFIMIDFIAVSTGGSFAEAMA